MTREDAIKTLKELWRETNDPWYEEVYNMAINALEADRLQGEWIDNGSWMGLECSRCKCHSQYVTPFCPQCGARMDGENQ